MWWRAGLVSFRQEMGSWSEGSSRLLSVDAGNDIVVFALISAGAIVARWRIATDPSRTEDEYAVWLNQLLQLEGYQRSDVHGVIIATVVPKALHNLTVLAQKYFGGDPLVAGEPPVEWGIALDEIGRAHV